MRHKCQDRPERQGGAAEDTQVSEVQPPAVALGGPCIKKRRRNDSEEIEEFEESKNEHTRNKKSNGIDDGDAGKVCSKQSEDDKEEQEEENKAEKASGSYERKQKDKRCFNRL